MIATSPTVCSKYGRSHLLELVCSKYSLFILFIIFLILLWMTKADLIVWRFSYLYYTYFRVCVQVLCWQVLAFTATSLCKYVISYLSHRHIYLITSSIVIIQTINIKTNHQSNHHSLHSAYHAYHNTCINSNVGWFDSCEFHYVICGKTMLKIYLNVLCLSTHTVIFKNCFQYIKYC